jgi:2-hydroxychromene-2-carboxylate isomerase
MSSEKSNLDVNVFWSMRSPYCYVALDRCLEMPRKYHVNLHLKICYPIAIKDASFFEAAKAMKYRLPYQNVDCFRTAFFHGVPMRYPDPDPVKQKPAEDSPYGEILPFEEQTDIQMLCRTAVGAAEMGKGWEYLNEVMRLVWNGQKRPWNADKYRHVREAIQAAGIDADALIKEVEADPDKYDALIESNQALQLENDARHSGVPNFIFRNEPFFGQDRMDQLVWRLKQYGLTERADYEPSLRKALDPDWMA